MVKINTVGDNILSSYFESPKPEFSSIGRVVSLLVKEVDDALNILLIRKGSVVTVYNDNLDRSGAPEFVDYYTSQLPANNTKNYLWFDQSGFPYKQNAQLTLEAMIEALFVDYVGDLALSVNQSTGKISASTSSVIPIENAEIVASFINQEQLLWE